ncbi:hypothetical protein GWG65_29740 [Bradyrhizobium sp. CSA207]|uniref:hypothetical protein n=1 Tax=Bradyrhizobium sp. CSA207 TaxID=2698826 RepID=UPI0023AEF1DD|nr:hypothetical protein [Bradyrhizobium sp. CSA207]MDE5445535.1 hypothetical protein [Bradyrhizobium sp. CSA207]
MIKILIALGVAMNWAIPAYAQQHRAKLDAPGKVAFSTTYEQAKTLLGSAAEAYEIDPLQTMMGCLAACFKTE